jgi:hypothetical protein
MRAGDPPVQYLVGTPKGRLSKLEKDLNGTAVPKPFMSIGLRSSEFRP